MSEPQAVWEGTLTLFGVTVRCYVLDNGQRLLDADDAAAMFRAMAEGAPVTEAEARNFANFNGVSTPPVGETEQSHG